MNTQVFYQIYRRCIKKWWVQNQLVYHSKVRIVNCSVFIKKENWSYNIYIYMCYNYFRYMIHTGFFKKTTNQLEVWRGEVDTPGPPISMLCDSSAWWTLQKNSHSCSGHWEAMFSNIETGGPGASGGCWNFLVGGCFFWRTRYDDFF